MSPSREILLVAPLFAAIAVALALPFLSEKSNHDAVVQETPAPALSPRAVFEEIRREVAPDVDWRQAPNSWESPDWRDLAAAWLRDGPQRGIRRERWQARVVVGRPSGAIRVPLRADHVVGEQCLHRSYSRLRIEVFKIRVGTR